MAARDQKYALHDNGEPSAPDYDRVARSLTDADLEEEILAKRGESGYQLALLAEAERRAKGEA